jgi:hypothetical protein
MPIIAKLSLGFAVLFWVEAAFWFGLPWWLVGAGMYNGPIPIIGGAFRHQRNLNDRKSSKKALLAEFHAQLESYSRAIP